MAELLAPQIYELKGFTDNILPGKLLDVGCGMRKLPGAMGMDIIPLPTVDIVHDMNKIPWPIEDNTFDLILLNHALEHVADVVQTMNEIHRVCKADGRVVVQVPYFRSVDAYTDPTHIHFFTSDTLECFVAQTSHTKYHYTNAYFHKVGFWFGYPQSSQNPLKRLVKSFMYKHPRLYDQYLSLIAPMSCLTWELQKI